jgi:hypothetical protein
MPAKGGSKSASEGTGLPVPSQPPAGSPAEAGTAALRTSPESRFPIFYRSLTAIDAERHRGKSLTARLGFNFAKASHAVLLNGSEFEAAARHYPIVFTPAPTTSALCVLGVRPESNLFVDAKGDWRAGSYVPAYIRRYPFIFHESADKKQYTLCLDETSGAIEDGNERPLFVDDKPSEIVQSALQFCAAFQRDYGNTHDFVEQLNERGLLIPNQADITLHSGEKLSVTGFHVIDRDRFSGLPDSAFLEWRRKGWLPWVFAHFISHGNWSTLVDLAAIAARAA